jgi:glycerophosphoryl diester phosphodiesterase
MPNPFTSLMSAAKAHALAHGAHIPALSPNDACLVSTPPTVDVAALHAIGVKVVPWTTNDPARMKQLIAMNIDGLVSDRPDLLQQVRGAAHFEVQGHRGARGLRPENTLPSFEAALDHQVDAIETDIGITRDRRTILWHEQFLNPESCRRADGETYDYANAVWLRDVTLAELQRDFICDKLLPGFPDQRNDLSLSPVAAAFATQEKLLSPYSPISVGQLFRFAGFYATWYKMGPGQTHPDALQRALNAAEVRFNLETKILPWPDGGDGPPDSSEEPTTNHTVDPQTFINTLCGAIVGNRRVSRCRILSFDFRTLQLVEEQFPALPTYYLTEEQGLLSSALVPASLRQHRAVHQG